MHFHFDTALVLFLAALLLGASPAAAQQTASLCGHVCGAETGETLLQANIVVQGTSRGTATNNDGYYTL